MAVRKNGRNEGKVIVGHRRHFYRRSGGQGRTTALKSFNIHPLRCVSEQRRKSIQRAREEVSVFRCFFFNIEARNYRETYKMHKIRSLRPNEYEISQHRIRSEIFINPILLSFVPELRTVHAYTVALTNRMYRSIALAGQNIISLIDHFYQFLEPVSVKWAFDITREMYDQLGKRYRTIVSTDSSFLSNKLFQYKVHLLSHPPVKGIVIYPHLRLSRLTKHTLPETFIAQYTIGRGAMMARFKSASRRRSSTFTTTTFSSVRHPWNVLRAYEVYKLDN